MTPSENGVQGAIRVAVVLHGFLAEPKGSVLRAVLPEGAGSPQSEECCCWMSFLSLPWVAGADKTATLRNCGQTWPMHQTHHSLWLTCFDCEQLKNRVNSDLFRIGWREYDESPLFSFKIVKFKTMRKALMMTM